MEVEQITPKENPVIIRPSFKKICNNDACRAALFNQLLYCIANKVSKGGEYWYGTLEAIHEDIDESWSMSKMRKELDELIKQGIVGQRHNPDKKWDRTLQYFFGKKEAQKLKVLCKKLNIDLSSIGLPSRITHLLNITDAFDENNKCICQICQMDLLKTTDPFVKNNRAIPQVTTKVTSEVTTKVTYGTHVPVASDAHEPTHTSLFDLPLLDDESQEKKIPSQEEVTSPHTKPERPTRTSRKGKAATPPTENPPKPERPVIALDTDIERTFWNDLWCKVWFNEIAPDLTITAKGHVKKLAPIIKTIEQLNSLIDFAREELKQRNINQKAVQLGNLVNSHPRWKQTQTASQNSNQSTKSYKEMTREEVIKHILTIPTGLDHHNPLYAELQNCLNRLNPDDKADMIRQRMALQQQRTKEMIAS